MSGGVPARKKRNASGAAAAQTAKEQQPESAQPGVAAAGNMAMQRAAQNAQRNTTVDPNASTPQELACVPHYEEDAAASMQSPSPEIEEQASSPVAPSIQFDRLAPWLYSADGNTDEAAIMAELYGPNLSVPMNQTSVLRWEGLRPRVEKRYVVVPSMLRDFYYAEYEHAMRMREIDLDLELALDVIEIQYMPLRNPFARPAFEGRVIRIVERWALESFPTKPNYLDRLFGKLEDITFDMGIIATIWTNLYSYILENFDRADEIRALRDQYSKLHVGQEALPHPEFFGTDADDFFGILWNDVKSGAVASRIGNYFKGLLEAGIGFLKGLKMLITEPHKVLMAIWHLPGTLKTMWTHREQLWNAFLNASPDEQARMIGRVFGEIEIFIATMGAGSGSKAAQAPELVPALEVVANSAAALRTTAPAATIDLGVLGAESGRFTSLMAVTADAATSGQKSAEELQSAESQPKSATEPPKEPPKEPPVKKDLSKKEFDSLSFEERSRYVEQWMKERGIQRIEAVNDHHAWPKYLGGPENGPLIGLDEQLHRLFHAGLDKLLPRSKGGQFYAQLSNAEKLQNINALKAYARAFDMDYHTQIYPTLMKALKGTPYE